MCTVTAEEFCRGIQAKAARGKKKTTVKTIVERRMKRQGSPRFQEQPDDNLVSCSWFHVFLPFVLTSILQAFDNLSAQKI